VYNAPIIRQFKVDSAGSGKVSALKQANAASAEKLERCQTMRREA
jgi:hypothetical protein